MGYAPSAGATTIHQSTASVAARVVPKIVKVKFVGKYTGTIAMLWSSTGVKATAVTGTGTATYFGGEQALGYWFGARI
ncbi:MAG: hypothetical protein KGJ92_01830 [Actinomycetales bacterium]|nr:hypothetical protein [Actinomycetales bacterium]